MPLVQKPLCLIHFLVNSFFSFSSLWGNRLPSMKVKKVEYLWDKISSTGCKWSSLNALGAETPVSHSLLSESIFSFSAPLSRVIKSWTQLRCFMFYACRSRTTTNWTTSAARPTARRTPSASTSPCSTTPPQDSRSASTSRSA